MTVLEAPPRIWRRWPSPALTRAETQSKPRSDSSVRKRLGWIWALLFLNVMPYTSKSVLVPIPVSAGKVLTQGSLVVALVLALSINRRALVRPNLFLFLMTLICAEAAMVSLRGYFSFFGSDYRCARLLLMVAVLWLTTPWWGRQDMLLLRYHRMVLITVLLIAVAGILVSPSQAFAQAGGGRLGGTIWPMTPTQVAHYAAILTGSTVVLWLSGLMRTKATMALAVPSVMILLLTHTRMALIAMLGGVLIGALSLFASRKRVRKAIGITLVVAALVAISFSPFLKAWFYRGEEGHLGQLSGRTAQWTAVLAEPRTGFNTLFGYGVSNDSVNGLPIDSSWLATYQDQGLAGDVLQGVMLLVLIGAACTNPRGPRRAVALFMVCFCAIDSYTETGLGAASPFLLDLAVVMSLLAIPARSAVPTGDLTY